MLKENKSHSEISKEIGIHKSTIAQFKQIKNKKMKKKLITFTNILLSIVVLGITSLMIYHTYIKVDNKHKHINCTYCTCNTLD